MKQPVEYIKDARMKVDFQAFMDAQNPEEQDCVVRKYNEWFASLSESEQHKVTAARMESMRNFLEGAQINLTKLDAAIIRDKLGEIPDALSMSYIARTYFGKTSTWLYQRINGNKVNGREAGFTPNEARQLQNALHDLGHKLSSIVLI